jgi:glycosyltransferase involved in cell wall biosynthesis
MTSTIVAGQPRSAIDPVLPAQSGTLHRPRILLVGSHLPTSVGSRSVGEGLAERLGRAGFAVTLTSNQQARALRVADMLYTVWRARDLYDIVQLDVYSGTAFLWAEWVSRLVRALSKPLVLTLHGGNLPQFARRNPHRISRLFARAATITAPSQYLGDAFTKFKCDIRIIPNPIDLHSYHYRERDKPTAKLVWLRAFHRIYNPVLAVQVLARLIGTMPEAHLKMIGPDKDGSLADVIAEARRLNVYDRISFTGGISKTDVPDQLASADIFLNTTNVDNSPVSVLEAMATGLPVISTDVGGISYLIENERDGMLVPPADDASMANAVIRLVEQEGLAARVSRNGRKKAEGYDWNSVLPQWEDLLDNIALGTSALSA